MKYLFYDCECANSFDKVSKICSLGYVITDTRFNVLAKEDLIINPEDVFDYHLFQKNSKIRLAYDKKDFYKAPSFKERYNFIKNLFEAKDVIVFGFSISNDIKFLLDACKRYKLDTIKFHYADVQDIYQRFSGDELKTGLDHAIERLGIEHDNGILHKSDDDAYFTMKVLESIFHQNEDMDLLRLLKKYGLKIESLADYLKALEERKKKKEESKREYMERVSKVKTLLDLYDKACQNSISDKYSGKSFCFSNQVMRFADNAIKAQRIIYDNGGITTKDYKDGITVILGHKENVEAYNEKNIPYIWIDEII